MARLIWMIVIINIALMCVLAEEDKYDDRYDNINILEILNNDKMREQYYKCFTDAGPCATADAKFFKNIIGEAIVTQCKKCTEKQKYLLDQISDWYTKNQPEKWNQFIAKYLEDIKKKANKAK